MQQKNIDNSVRRIKPEYQKVCKPTLIKYFGFVPTISFILFLLIIAGFKIFLYFLLLIIITLLIFFGVFVIIDFVDLLTFARNPEIVDETIFDLNEDKNAYVFKTKDQGKYVQQFMKRNISKYEFDSLYKTLWLTKNIMFNFFLNIYGRVFYLAYYYLLVKLKIKNEKYIHPKAIYYYVINSSLSNYVEGNNPEITINDFYFVGNNRKSWSCQENYFYKVVLTVVHETEQTIKLDLYRSEKDWQNKKPDTLQDQYEILAVLMPINKFIAHTSIHTTAPFICDIDEKFLPQREIAEQAINGINNLIVKWEVLFIGKMWFKMMTHGTNSGQKYYAGAQPILEQKSQLYNAKIALRNDKEIQHMIDQSIKTLNSRRQARGLSQYSKEDLEKRRQNLQFGIESSILGHCCDHWVHDIFLSPFMDSQYLQFSEIIGTIMGARWTDDLVSNLKSTDQPLTKAVHRILKQEAPDLVESFRWTLFQ